MMNPATTATGRRLPKRIILVRHGESEGNVNEGVHSSVPNHRVSLSEQGVAQAKEAGKVVFDAVTEGGTSENWKVFFYLSPYKRTEETLRQIGQAFPANSIIGVREECRLREQDFGNFQDAQKMREYKDARDRYGRFFYRFPEGESAADVYDRVSSFLESLWRDVDMERLPHDHNDDLNLVIVSHGLSIRVFLMRWFRWTAEQFERLKSPKNCEVRVMHLGFDGEYSLAIHHDDEKLKSWGLSPKMIEDQHARAHGPEFLADKCFAEAFFSQNGLISEAEEEEEDGKVLAK